jgi:cytochrome c553
MLRQLALLMAAGCSTAPAPGTPEHGAQLYGDYCAPCHGDGGQGNPDIQAPSIAGLPAWYAEAQLLKFRQGVRGTHFDDIAGMRMRPMARALVSDAEATTVAAHVAQLAPQRPVATLQGDAAAGKALYTTCTACHQADGKGNQLLSAPPLLHQPDWYLVHQLDNFKKGVRGAHPKDASGATMRPMAATLADDAAMKNVIAYVQSLGG